MRQATQERDAEIAWQVLGTACDAAVAEGLLPSNTVALARRFKPRRSRRADVGIERHRTRVYTEEEVVKLKRAASGERHGGLVHLIFDTGLRPGEALGLQWQDIGTDTIHVRRGLQEYDNSLSLTATKTVGSRRTIYADPRTLSKLGPRQGPKDLVFKSRTGTLVRKNAIYKTWERIHRTSGVPREESPPKWARHTHATLLLSSGTPLPDISRRLGHKSIQTTLKYYAAWLPGEDRTKGAVQKLLSRSAHKDE